MIKASFSVVFNARKVSAYKFAVLKSADKSDAETAAVSTLSEATFAEHPTFPFNVPVTSIPLFCTCLAARAKNAPLGKSFLAVEVGAAVARKP